MSSQSTSSSSSSLSSSSSSSSPTSSSEDESSSDRVTVVNARGNNLSHFLNISQDRRYKKRKRSDESVGLRRQKRAYSDSDNSYQATKDFLPQKPSNVDWDDLADQSQSNELLYKNLSGENLSELIGWATNVSSHEKEREDSTELNPLKGLPCTPLPPSHLNFFAKNSVRIPEFDQILERKFGDSALVAIGMFVEEMITASLLPLAGYHVLRCRELEKSEGRVPRDDNNEESHSKLLIHPLSGRPIKSEQNTVKTTDLSSQEWTLPPEEAMLKLLEQNMLPAEGLEFHQKPSRSIISETSSSPSNWQSAESWIREQGLAPNFVGQNMDIFRLFALQDRSTNTGK